MFHRGRFGVVPVELHGWSLTCCPDLFPLSLSLSLEFEELPFHLFSCNEPVAALNLVVMGTDVTRAEVRQTCDEAGSEGPPRRGSQSCSLISSDTVTLETSQ